MHPQRRSSVPAEDRFDPTLSLLHAIVAGDTMTHAEAVTALRRLYARDPSVDARLLELMKEGPASEIPRLLRILSAASDGKHLVQGLLRYLSHPDPAVRAEAALLVARGQQSPALIKHLLQDRDPRVRANTVEGFSTWNRDPELLSQPLRDPHHRVICNAVVSLFALDRLRAYSVVAGLLEHPDWKFRAAATWAIGASGRSDLYPMAERMQSDAHPSVRFNALRAMSTLKRVKECA